MKPMAEAYFFGDSNALQMAGVNLSTTPLLVNVSDVEAFQSNDPAWLKICLAENLKRKIKTPWWQRRRQKVWAYGYMMVKRSGAQ